MNRGRRPGDETWQAVGDGVAEPPTVPGAAPDAGPSTDNGPAARAPSSPRPPGSPRPPRLPRLPRPESIAFHLALLGCYVVAGVAVSLPRASYLAGRLPAT